MKRFFLVTIILTIVSSGFVVAGMSGVSRGSLVKKASYKPDTILVRFKPGASEEAKGQAKKELKAVASKSFHFVDGLVSVKLPPGRKVEDAIAQILKNPNVLYAEPDYELAPSSTNDSSWNELWGLHNTGQTVNYTTGTADADMNIPEAWSNGGTTGSSDIVIGVIDTGVNYNHPDLQANLWVNPNEIAGNGIDDDGNGYVDDVYGANTITGSGDPMDGHNHGTHVAGTIAAVGNNGAGITGVNQSAKVVSCKFLPDSGSGSTTDAIECLEYMYDLKQAGVNLIVTNNSWGGGGYSASLESAIDAHRQAGIVFVAAAGNDNTNNDSGAHYPSNYFLPNVISVAATDQNDSRASFSNYGRRSVHVGAPGVNIYSTVGASGYAHYQGTSMASPHVAGLVALLKAKNPALDWIGLKNLVVASGTPTTSISSNTVTGRRVRAWDSDGTGAMTCSNQTVKSMVYPQSSSTIAAVAGGKVDLAMMHINCASPAGNLVVTTSGPESVADLTLYDDGQGFDQVAGDGIYSGEWTAPNTSGSYTLTLADGQTVSVSVTGAASNGLTPYRTPVEIAYNPRSLYYGVSPVPDGYSFYVNGYTSYFKIPFGGYSAGFDTIYATTNGTAMMSAPSANQLTGANGSLPDALFETLIAPYWDDLDLSGAGDGFGAEWWADGVGGGEVIMQWRGRQKSSGNLVEVQLVFTANSSDVEMHYISSDNGAQSATVGIQVDGTRGASQSVDTSNSNLVSGKAWRWSLDSGAPTVDAGVTQNVDGNSTVNLGATGSDPDGGSLSYQWTQQSGTAVSISNASSQNASFVAPNNTESLVFKVTATDDAGQTATDTVTINVTAVSAGPGDIALAATSYSVAENGASVTITASRSGGTTGAVSVNFATSNGTATAGSDYVANSGTLNWADGESGDKSFTVTISDDTDYEGDENFSVALSNAGGGASLGSNSATVTISENDPIPVPGNLAFSSASYSVAENGGSVTISVTRSGGSDGAVSVNYATSNGSATAGSDYTAASGTLNWADGESGSKTFTVSVLDDSSYEGSESVNLGLSNATGGASITGASSTLTISEDDPQPVPGSLSLSASSYSVAENGGSVTITVSRSTGSDGAVSVNYATSNGSASAGSDYTAASGTLNWADGESGNKSFTVTISDDAVYEGNETLSIGLSSVSGGVSLGTSSATVTITDNDAAPAYGSLGFDSSSYSVNEQAGTVTINVTRSNGSSGAVSVNYATSNGSANASDYSAASGTLNWADGDTASKSFTITINDDAVYEGNETVNLSLSSVSGGAVIVGGTATLTINDNEQANVAPTAPKLVSPGNGELGVTPVFTLFEWMPSRDKNRDNVSYDFYYCTDAGFSGCSPYNVVASADGNSGMMMAGLGGGSGLLMLGMVYGLSRRRKWLYLGMAVLALSLGACKPENPNTIKVTVVALDQDTTYYWKVIAKDGKGGETSSEVWSFTTGQ